ncbi:hypothetical protein EVAR_42964_1 [Eumeta japonica]|uniref:Uncharacterized protein n=1 Tax=Eumeta variegata TaxID=151549 RepID=A0A4C1YG74_EUMVA|nr:hypothetical protein EVAR_42964_1 [Eumeta japonica]
MYSVVCSKTNALVIVIGTRLPHHGRKQLSRELYGVPGLHDHTGAAGPEPESKLSTGPEVKIEVDQAGEVAGGRLMK